MTPLAITLGDPAGIGTETTLEALQSIGHEFPVVLFGDWNLAQQTAAATDRSFDFTRISESELRGSSASRLFVDVALAGDQTLRHGVVDALYGKIALDSITAAVTSIEQGHCAALVTAPVHKQAIRLAGASFPGHTELLAQRAGLTKYGKEFAMYFDSPKLKVVLLSVHVSLVEAIAQVSSDSICDITRLTAIGYQKLYGNAPRIAIAGLNPHAGEGGAFGSEEIEIADAVRRCRDEGLEVTGPLSPDTVFLATTKGAFDLVVAMYHDQGLIPVKTMYFNESVNVTMGLPYLRCSVDHGTAFDIAGQGVADSAPSEYAIRWAWKQRGKFA